MKKKFTSMLLLLVSCVMSAMAQQVASTPTAWSDIQSGNQYLVLVKSKLTSENGNFMYLSTTDKYAHVDGSTEPKNFIGTQFPITEDSEKYIWFVTKNGDKITIKSKANNTGFAGTGQNDNSLNLSANLTTYDVKEETDGSVTLSYYGSYWSWGTKYYTTYITSKEDSDKGGFCTSTTKGESTAKFVFYEIEQPTIITYNYTDPFDHKVRYSYDIEAYDGQEYPESPILDVNLPEYVSLGDVYQASGIFNVGTSQTSFNFELNVNLPFTTSTDDAPVYYYLVNGTDERHMLYNNNSSVGVRNDAQAEQLNNVRNDLWYVKGNPFDGYQFANVATGNLLHCYYSLTSILAGSSYLSFNGLAGNIYTWSLEKIDDNAFAVKGDNHYWNLNGSQVMFTSSLTIDDNHTFRLIPATITLPLNYSEADGKTFATTCLPYAVEVAEGQESIKAYAGKLNDEQTELNMNAVTAVPANQGVILSGENAGDTEVVLNVLASADNIDNDLLGTTSEMSTDGILALGRANGDGAVGFFRSTNATLSANRAYLLIANEAIQALAMNFGGTTTGINNANKHVNLNAPIYDLSGRRVFNTVKGNIYLQQGRKFIAQ